MHKDNLMLKKNYKKLWLMAVLALLTSLTSVTSWAQAPSMDQYLGQKLAQDSTVTVGKLSNGLTYYIKPNAKPAKKVELRLVLKAGSILENDHQQGLAHFMEHMEFNGLKHYPKNELVDYLQKIGVRFGADLNANTGWDRTYYMLPIPTDNPENLEKGFQILGDWASGALISSAEVNEERHVILEELRMRDLNAQTRMLRKFLPELLNGSRYAYRMSGGKDSIVASADPQLIRDFYHDWYRPDLMAVIAVGDITVNQAKALIKQYFGQITAPSNERQRTYYHVQAYTNKKALVVTDSESTSYQYALLYPARKRQVEKTVGDFRKSLIKSIFSQSMNRKFRDLAATSNPPFANAQLSLSGTVGAVTLEDEGMELDVTPVGNLNRSVRAAIGALLNVRQYGFTKEEINTVKKMYLPYYENNYRERNDLTSASFTDGYADAFMKNTPLIGIANEYGYVKQLLPTITDKDINDYAKTVFITPEHYFVMVTGPKKGKLSLPTEDELLQLTDAAFVQKTKRDTAEKAAIELLSQEPTTGKVVAQSQDTALSTVTYTLSNGIKVTVKSTDFFKDQVLFSGIKYGGSNQYGVADKSNIAFLGNVIGAMGYGSFTPTKLNDFLSGVQASVGVGLTGLADQVNGRSSVKDLKTLLQLTYLKLTSPRKDTALLQGFLSKVEARLPLLKADPGNAFKDSLTKVMYGHNPLAPMVIPSQEDMRNIDVDRIIQIYKTEFNNADGFHFSLLAM
ncbi:insulinase family protein [Arachidicoccus ginsenosidivorans]|uniref:Insulinase family protein n=1 Tax=Arachidicoccus ginsenosidivorans TaxID=496057 RepID=A0A5B8VSW6_9BACT|nr:pitrilysin family protein [Arachidicoccus ginsenosidivorans]QEC74002.1 insulinase family protein [Arachidicoccus ginsenosidivorans]